ncbi:hypothetical protein DPMN_115854 [Dreissena polymorpha]|uniref:Uncharacterized protein n=1 Tax=Dreissena polymorpha TaxID=45954 RepID=A0A9D4QTR3_DREPO|nr:hypothetical protein DPMN_115854 [Dreissena polymorpha]
MKTTAGDSERGHKGRAVLALSWQRRPEQEFIWRLSPLKHHRGRSIPNVVVKTRERH